MDQTSEYREKLKSLFPSPKGGKESGGHWRAFLAAWRTERVGPIPGSLASSVLLSVLLAGAFFGLGQVAFPMEVEGSRITSQVFFPEGIALVFVILFGPRVAPGALIGQFLLGVVSGVPLLGSLMIALVSSGVAILGGKLFWSWRISPHLNRPREMALLVVLCALVLQPIGATGGILAHYFFNDLPAALFGSFWGNWWISSVLGQVLVVPLALSWLSRAKTKQDRGEIHRGLLMASLYFMPLALFIFGDWQDVESLYRLLLFAGFYLPLMGTAALCRVQTVSLIAFLLTLPVILLVHMGPTFSAVFSEPVRYFSANLILFAGVVAALLISSLREELMLRNHQLHDAVAARERLFAVIGHDLRGPIGILRTYLDLMISGDLSKKEFEEVQHDLRKGVNDAHAALEGLLEWGTSLAPKFRPVNLRKCAGEAIGLLALTASGKKITIENAIPDQSWVEADGYQLESVFRNLLSNAVKFTRPGGRVTLSAEMKSGMWSVAVSDNGIGMTRDRADRLFRPSSKYRSTPGTANERGLGLGLQLSREFVHINGGTIEVTSKPPVGTTFYVKLPALDVQDSVAVGLVGSAEMA